MTGLSVSGIDIAVDDAIDCEIGGEDREEIPVKAARHHRCDAITLLPTFG